ncbi:hypothetical protein SISSUDRAFT_1089399 [Sistotremastrum suecicum HHB10207 ss-3]|uniref:Ubiquitin 3 binding protein But2 C-terminal domain-containing protein n=1 Tax=Sistotremastrum suecicum HHB10207 ss-3 TaxID=1314776 RepID=A0A165YJI9_9AGAM|nr:hypothetical protein SISSUDRAFT_1089399 [Sistotremastrum suecicum HHB10207 ss-3]
MLSPHGRGRYEAVKEEDSSENGSVGDDSQSPQRQAYFTIITCLIAILCTVANASFTLLGSPKAHIEDAAILRRPSQFIGLDRANFSREYALDFHIKAFPSVLTQISRVERNKVFEDDPKRQFTRFGTISPDDKHFVVTEEISTIAQFRARDYGMENCQLKLSFPHTEAQEDYIPEDPIKMTVWRLQTSTWLNPRLLSFNTRPAREAAVVTWTVDRGANATSPMFLCSSDSLQSFEITCESGPCSLELWQDKEEPIIGDKN